MCINQWLFQWRVAAAAFLAVSALSAPGLAIPPWLQHYDLHLTREHETPVGLWYPSVGFGVGTDTNYLQQAGSGFLQDEPTPGALRVIPALGLTWQSKQAAVPSPVAARLQGLVGANVLAPRSQPLSGELSESSHIFFDADAEVGVSLNRWLTLHLLGDTARVLEPELRPDSNRAYARQHYGGESVLSMQFPATRVNLAGELFQTDVLQPELGALDFLTAQMSAQVEVDLGTDLELGAEVEHQRVLFEHESRQANGASSGASLGATLRTGSTLEWLVYPGYAFLDFDSGADFSGPVGLLGVDWYALGNPEREVSAEFALVGLRAFRRAGVSLLGNYHVDHSLWIRAAYVVSHTYVFALDGIFSHVSRPRTLFESGVLHFDAYSENRLELNWFSEVQLTDRFATWWRVNYMHNFSGSNIPQNPEDLRDTDAPAFQRLSVILGGRVNL